jgi:hypothetical protein
MGLQNSQSESVIFLQISNGKIVRQVKTKTDNSVSRVNKLGREVHELFYDSITGVISDITTRESEYGKSWVVSIKSEGKLYKLEFNYSSGYATTFLKALPNVSFGDIVTLSPKLIIDGDKKKSVLFISQDGKGLKHFFTKDNPNGLPELKKIKIKGKESWDDSDRMEFLEQYVKDNILPMIKSDLQDAIEGQEVPF